MMGRVLRDGLWWLTLAVAVAITVASLPGYATGSLELIAGGPLPIVQLLASWSGRVLSLGASVLCLVLAVLVYRRKPGEWMAIVFSYFMVFYGLLLVGPLEYFVAYWVPGFFSLILLLQGLLLPVPLLLVLLIFPTGRFAPRWSRWLVVAGGIGSILAFLILDSDELLRASSAEARVYYWFMFVLLVVTVGVQRWRYVRLYSPAERQQTSWVLIGMAAAFGLILLVSIPYYAMLNAPPGTPTPWWAPISSLGWWFALIIVPLAMAVAILRYRLWDIDVIIRRTLLYTLLSMLLGLVYLGSVLILQRFLEVLTGRQSPLGIVLSTLLIAALFSPMRQRLQRLIDRRFYRRRYDAARILARFAQTARDEVDTERLAEALLQTVDRTMKPEQAVLWLKPVDSP